MGNDLTDERVLKLSDPLLEALAQKKAGYDAEIARYVGLILDEFWRTHPKLIYVDELSLSLESMRAWLVEHQIEGEG